MVGREVERRARPRGAAHDRRGRCSRSTGSRRHGDRGDEAAARRLARRARRRDRRRSPASRATASASWPRRSPGCGRSRRAGSRVGGDALADGRSARGDPAGRRARARGPAAHRRRAEPQHRVEHRAQVVPHATARAGRCSGCGRIRDRRRRADRALRRDGAGAGDAGAPALRRQPAEGRARAASSRASRACSSPPRRRAGSTSARSRRCTPTCARPRHGGVAVLLISEDLDEVLALADRIAVMYEGAIVGEVDARTRDRRGDRAADGRRRRRPRERRVSCGSRGGSSSRAG